MTWNTEYKIKEKWKVTVSPIFGTCPNCGSKDDLINNKDMTKIICVKCNTEIPVNWVA